MDDDEFQKTYLKQQGEDMDSNKNNLTDSINYFMFWEWYFKVHEEQIEKAIYNTQVEINQKNVVMYFYILYCSYNDFNVDVVKRSVIQLTIFAQLITFKIFEEFFNYGVPKLIVDLFSSDDIEIHELLVLFLTELGKSKEQILFEPIIKCSFIENMVHSASQNLSNESFIKSVLEFFQVTYQNFQCTRTEILRTESLSLFTNVMLNSKFSDEMRRFPIQILGELSQFSEITSIQKSQICDFFVSSFDYKKYKNQKFVIDALENLKTIIINDKLNPDEKNDIVDMKLLQSICIYLMMESKNAAILTDSILILNLHFNYASTPIQIISEEALLMRLLKLSNQKNCSLSRAALLLINNMMKSDNYFFNFFISNDIIPIVLSKLDGDFKIKTKYAAALILTLIVMNGSIEQQLLCAQSNFIHYLLDIISFNTESFASIAFPPLMTLLEKGATDPQFSFVWESFEEEEGFDIIYELKESSDKGILENIDPFIEQINRMKDSLDQ